MATPPVQVAGSPFQSTWSGAGTKTGLGGGFTIDTGGLVVVLITNESSNTISTALSNAGTATISFTQRAAFTTGSSNCYGYVYSGSCTAGGTVSCQAGFTSGNWGMWMAGFLAANHGGLGQTPAAAAQAAGSQPSLTANWAANSLVAALIGDFNAGATTGKTYRANIGTPTEVSATNVDSNYTIYAFYHPDSGSGGNVAIGMTAPTQTPTNLAIEVLGTAGTVPQAVWSPHRMPLV